MVVIRLSRRGAKGRPFFDIVAADSRSRRDGRFIERLGFHNAHAKGKEEMTRVVQDRLAYWLSVGAKMSMTVERLVRTVRRKALLAPLTEPATSTAPAA